MPIIRGLFKQLIYSPRGAIEGVLMEVGGAPAQLVFDKHDEQSPAAFLAIAPGQLLAVDATPQGASPKGPAAHDVYAFVRLTAIDGKKPPKPKPQAGPVYQGTVARLNYARHGAANGVVLDTGDFIHTRPEGMARLKLKIGDSVKADGDAQFLATGKGWAVEATKVNGKALGPKK